ncbi:hypothetical protein OTK49_01045 [Vibrio coralliirubri]|uniref:hypothetical protein n=1 Tax=Vibrio coralliirubri TaxID=1516159 RepID=UPI0022852DD6|nr:hypothetical protein [Vibrio coralliirubri]MCY9861115.1 hypothetical protein [Vibrio coralliirubri]
MDNKTASLIQSLILIGNETSGKTLTGEQRADAKTRIAEVFAKSGKKYPRHPRKQKGRS